MKWQKKSAKMLAMKVLGIETSCDETGLAIYDSQSGLLAHVLYSQVALHQAFGGVVPELASRDHVRKLLPLLHEVLAKAKLRLQDLDGIAYTAGPGLMGAVLVGASFGRSLAYALGIPSIGVHHMEGHLLAPLIEGGKIDFPFLALLVSGGHTFLAKVAAFGQYEILGESLDDAAGEAFDKTAKLLGLPYPGGPQLAKLALQGSATRFDFPRPMLNRPGLDFSFSGLKTSAALLIREQVLTEPNIADIAASFEAAVVDTLIAKSLRALTHAGLTRLVVAGGVSANQRLRQELAAAAHREGFEVHYPALAFCTDNGAMIAYAGCQRLQRGFKDEGLEIFARPRWDLGDLRDCGNSS